MFDRGGRSSFGFNTAAMMAMGRMCRLLRYARNTRSIIGRPEFIDYDEPPQMPNIVEMVADQDDCAWDQPCAFGYRVEHHAVYCHNEKWLYAPGSVVGTKASPYGAMNRGLMRIAEGFNQIRCLPMPRPNIGVSG